MGEGWGQKLLGAITRRRLSIACWRSNTSQRINVAVLTLNSDSPTFPHRDTLAPLSDPGLLLSAEICGDSIAQEPPGRAPGGSNDRQGKLLVIQYQPAAAAEARWRRGRQRRRRTWTGTAFFRGD